MNIGAKYKKLNNEYHQLKHLKKRHQHDYENFVSLAKRNRNLAERFRQICPENQIIANEVLERTHRAVKAQEYFFAEKQDEIDSKLHDLAARQEKEIQEHKKTLKQTKKETGKHNG
ncbi:MAG: hypothetical protein LBB42_00365 [Coriobacteriales bacterium]|nr:hypothetical protein [Coriobacteriales bacterium]